MNEVRVRTGARLHFGFLNWGAPGRQGGGLGLMLARPGWEVALTTCPEGRAALQELSGNEDEIGGICRELIAQIRASVEGTEEEGSAVVEAAIPGASGLQVSARIGGRIPWHVGLGAGTQLALAVARGAAELAGMPQIALAALVRWTGRGARSAVGSWGFAEGGFLVDAGSLPRAPVPTLPAENERCVWRVNFPAEWRIVLVRPRRARGLSGQAERRAFETLPPMSSVQVGELCRRTLLEIVPAVQTRDFEGTAAALGEFGLEVGKYFSRIQGAAIGDPRMARLVESLRREGFGGCGQSSWGPTVFVLARDEDHAAEARRAVERIAGNARDAELLVATTSARNSGAERSWC